MPHAGGGGHSGGGGFHSSGSHNSSSSKPRYDNQGRLHSAYYIRPGFYYRTRYIPYTSKGRKSISNFAAAIIGFVVSIIFILLSVFVISCEGKYDDDRLESKSFELYSEVYDKNSSDYERNILITFVTYEDNHQFDYFCIIGDWIDSSVDWEFGDNNSTFGKTLINNVPSEYSPNDICKYLSISLNTVNEDVGNHTQYSSNNFGKPNNSSILNKTSLDLTNGKSDLESSIDEFYKLTGDNITFVIDDNMNFYSVQWGIVIILIGLSAIMMVLGVVSIINKKKDIKHIENAIKNGEASKYYEGEDPFEEYYKNHPLI